MILQSLAGLSAFLLDFCTAIVAVTREFGRRRPAPIQPIQATAPGKRSSHRQLDASVGASGPHGFAVRLKRIRQSAIRVHRIPPPTSVTIAKRPSIRRPDGGGYAGDLG
jgi:hypothetical protein